MTRRAERGVGAAAGAGWWRRTVARHCHCRAGDTVTVGLVPGRREPARGSRRAARPGSFARNSFGAGGGGGYVRACARVWGVWGKEGGGATAALVRAAGFYFEGGRQGSFGARRAVVWCGGAGADLWRAARSRSRIWAGVRPRRAAARRRSTARRCSGERSSARAGISGFSGPGTPGSAHTAHDEAPHGIGSEPAGPARPGMRERGDWSLGVGRGGDRMSLSVPMGPPARPPAQTRRSPPARPATRRPVGVRARHGGAQ